VSCGQVHVGVQGSGKASQMGDSGSVPPSSMHSISSRVMSARGQIGDTKTEGAALVIDGLTEGQGFGDGEPFRSSACGSVRTQRV